MKDKTHRRAINKSVSRAERIINIFIYKKLSSDNSRQFPVGRIRLNAHITERNTKPNQGKCIRPHLIWIGQIFFQCRTKILSAWEQHWVNWFWMACLHQNALDGITECFRDVSSLGATKSSIFPLTSHWREESLQRRENDKWNHTLASRVCVKLALPSAKLSACPFDYSRQRSSLAVLVVFLA